MMSYRPPGNLPPPPASRKRDFLLSLGSTGKLEYKRYTSSPLRYAGGKSLAVGFVVELLPSNLKRIVSPFIGGGSIEIACANELGLEVVGYEVFDILCNYWHIQLNRPQQLAARLRKWEPDKTIYTQLKTRLKAHWDETNPVTDKEELAALYWFNHNLSYGPGFLGWMSKIYQEKARVKRLIDKVNNFRCPGLSVKHGSFEHTIPQHRDDFLYCDPPYYLGGDSKMFRGIYPQRNFPVHHNGFEHAHLRDLLHEHRGGFVLSYNDCETIRDWYSDFRIVEVKWQYTLGQGETRIGKNRLENGSGHIKGSHELLIVKDA